MNVRRLIGDEGDIMSVQDPGVFWYKARLTLRSPLTPQQVREQLSKALPRFELDTGCPVPHLRLFIPGRIFSIEVSEDAFRVSGPLYRSRGAVSSFGGLVVSGRVEPDEQGSLIHLTAENGGVHIAFFIGLVLIAWSVCAVATDFFPVMVCGGVPLTLLGSILYLSRSRRSRTALEPLVLCLEKMLRAQRTL